MLEELYEDNLIGDPADLEEIIREHEEEQDDNPDDPESRNLEGYDDQEIVGAAENENENTDAAATTTEKPKKKVIRRPQFTLDPRRLTGPRGVGVLENTFKDFKFLGKGHEKEDLNRVMKQLEHWAHRMFPKYQFDDCLEKIEKLGLKKEVQTYVKKIRLGMETGEQDMVLREGNEEEQQAMENDAPTDAFDELLGRQIQIETERQNNESSTRTTPAQPKAPPLPSSSSQNTIQLTEEQRERMLRNRLLAEERRLARLKAKREAELAAQQASTLGLTISNISADNSAGDNTTSDSQQPSVSGVGIANTTVAADVQTSTSESVTNELNSQDLLSAVSKTVESEPTPQSQKPSTSGLDSSSRTSTNSLDSKNVHSISHLENSKTDIVNHHTDTNDISQSYNIDTPVKEGTVLNSLKEDNIASKQLNPEESNQNSSLEEEGLKQLNPKVSAQSSLLEEDIIVSKQLNPEEIVQNSLLEENSTVSKQLNPEESAKDSLLEEDNISSKQLNSEVLEEDNTKQLNSEECSQYSLLKENDSGSKQLNSEEIVQNLLLERDSSGSKQLNSEKVDTKIDNTGSKQLNLEDTGSKEYNASSKQLNSEESGQNSLSEGFRKNIVDSSKSFMLDEGKSPTVSIINCETEPMSLLEKEAETPPQAATEKTSSTLLNVQTKDLSLAINEEENRQVSQSVNIEDNVTLSSSADKELTIPHTAIDVQNSINGSKDITEIITETMIIDTENVNSNSTTTVFTESRSDTKELDDISKLDERNNIPESTTIDKVRSDLSSDGNPKSSIDEDPNAMEIDTSFGTNET